MKSQYNPDLALASDTTLKGDPSTASALRMELRQQLVDVLGPVVMMGRLMLGNEAAIKITVSELLGMAATSVLGLEPRAMEGELTIDTSSNGQLLAADVSVVVKSVNKQLEAEAKGEAAPSAPAPRSPFTRIPSDPSNN
jgi:hypothetical protein